MNNRIKLAIIVCTWLCSLMVFGNMSKPFNEQLNSETRHGRVSALNELSAEYHSISTNLIGIIQGVLPQDRHFDYMSSEHVAILAIGALNANATEDALLNIIDFEIRKESVPLGICVAESFYYPAAATLVKLRVDVQKVVRAISSSNGEKQRLLLAWVLLKRTGSVGAASSVLMDAEKRFHGNSEKANIREVEMIVKSRGDLIAWGPSLMCPDDIPMLAAGSLPVRFTQEELLIKSAGVMVKDVKHALRIALEAYHQKKSGFSAMEGYTRPILFQLGSEIKGFAQDGDKVWEVRITSLTKDGCRTLRAIVWVHAQTGRTHFLF